MAFDRLIENIVEKQNPTVAGLDPKLDYIPSYIKEKAYAQYGKTLEGAAEALFEYNKGLTLFAISFRQLSHRQHTMKCTAGRA